MYDGAGMNGRKKLCYVPKTADLKKYILPFTPTQMDTLHSLQ